MAEGDEIPETPPDPEVPGEPGVPDPPPPPVPLARVTAAKNMALLRHEAATAIDAKADEVRARFATPGKHTIYDRKLREAERYLDALSHGNNLPSLNGYPYLRAETGLTAPGAEALARLWVAMSVQWETVSPAIEALALGAKAAVRAAGSKAAVDAAAAQATAALDAIGEKPPQRPDKPRAPFRPPFPET